MSDSDEHKMFRTLRGFLKGEEPHEANSFCFSMSGDWRPPGSVSGLSRPRTVISRSRIVTRARAEMGARWLARDQARPALP